MIDLVHWLMQAPGIRFVPLFDADASGVVAIQRAGNRTVLRRSPAMDEAVITLVETGLQDPRFTGLLYVMGWGTGGSFRVLYVGKAERRGVKHPLSYNLTNLRSNRRAFARWGDGRYYHIGDLSAALFGADGQPRVPPKYVRWAKRLFSSVEPPRLVEPVHLVWVPWFLDSRGPSGLVSSLPAAEKEVIALAGTLFPTTILNADGI